MISWAPQNLPNPVSLLKTTPEQDWCLQSQTVKGKLMTGQATPGKCWKNAELIVQWWNHSNKCLRMTTVIAAATVKKTIPLKLKFIKTVVDATSPILRESLYQMYIRIVQFLNDMSGRLGQTHYFMNMAWVSFIQTERQRNPFRASERNSFGWSTKVWGRWTKWK